jgi:predicted amidophosphoribosyltransferase
LNRCAVEPHKKLSGKTKEYTIMEIPRHWRLRKQRYSMVGGVCPNCETKTFPAREICPNCGHGVHFNGHLSAPAELYAQPVALTSHVLSA